MTTFLFIAFLALGFIFFISYTKWKNGKNLLGQIDLSKYVVFTNKTLSVTSQLSTGESFPVPVTGTILINDRELHLIPTRFTALLFMTDYPLSFFKKNNRKLKLKSLNPAELTFTGKKSKSSVFGSVCNVTIKGLTDDEKSEFMKMAKRWR